MITITAERAGDGLEIVAAGHAGYGTRGQDIVCAGVSALLFGFVAYLEDRIAPAADTSEAPAILRRTSDGYLWVRTHRMSGADEAAWAVTAAGLSLISHAYPASVSLRDSTTIKPKERTNDGRNDCL